MSYLLVDTDVWSYWFKEDTRGAAYRSLAVGQDLCVSFQTVAELYQWAENLHWGTRKLRLLAQDLRPYMILDSDMPTARQWAHVRITRKRQGQPITAQDAWIAACALRHGYPLLTNNAADYGGIPGLEIITLSS